MFGFSLQKLIALAAIVAIVWYGFRWAARYQRLRRSAAGRPARAQDKAAPGAAEELERCPKCGAFVPAAAPHDCA